MAYTVQRNIRHGGHACPSTFLLDGFRVLQNCIAFEVLKAMSIHMTAFWDVMRRSLVDVCRRFGKTPPSSRRHNPEDKLS
jgi:hypothetical protein